MVDGWLYVGWNYVDSGSDYYYGVTDTPAIWQEFTVEPVPPQFPHMPPMPVETTFDTPTQFETQPAVSAYPVEFGSYDGTTYYELR